MWSREATESFIRMARDKPMLMMVYSVTQDVYNVDLSKPPLDVIEDDRPVSVRDALVRQFSVSQCQRQILSSSAWVVAHILVRSCT